MERTIAKSLVTPATLVQCSAMAIPGDAVGMDLVGPWVSAPGLGSKVSNWLGPPAIHRRMHDRCDLRSSSACSCRQSSHELPSNPAAPAPLQRKNPRRLTAPVPSTRTLTHVCDKALTT